jgi:hypothetical protein
MPSIVSIRLAVTTTGSAGSATGSTTSETVFGELLDVFLDFHASAPGTTDTTLAYATGGQGVGNIVVVTDSATDARLAPRQKCVDNANAAITNSFDRFWINGAVTLSLAGCDALTDAVVAYIRVLRP